MTARPTSGAGRGHRNLRARVDRGGVGLEEGRADPLDLPNTRAGLAEAERPVRARRPGAEVEGNPGFGDLRAAGIDAELGRPLARLGPGVGRDLRDPHQV